MSFDMALSRGLAAVGGMVVVLSTCESLFLISVVVILTWNLLIFQYF